MENKVIVVYKSSTGFTKKYGEWIAEELNCEILPLAQVNADLLSKYEIVVYGGPMHGGHIADMKKARELFDGSAAKKLIIYATGAMPNEGNETIQEMWRANFNPDELAEIPHFYMQAGLNFEQMPLGEKLMIKTYRFILSKKKNPDEVEKEMAEAMKTSYDITSKEYIGPLVDQVKEELEKD